MSPERLLPLYLLLFGHIIADYFCQNRRFTDRKRRRLSYLLFHFALVWTAGMLVLLPYHPAAALVPATIIALCHLAIDGGKIRLEKMTDGICRTGEDKTRIKQRHQFYNILDQLLHFAVILLVWRIFLAEKPWPFLFPAKPVFLNSFAVLVIISVVARGILGIVSKGDNHDSQPEAGHNQGRH